MNKFLKHGKKVVERDPGQKENLDTIQAGYGVGKKSGSGWRKSRWFQFLVKLELPPRNFNKNGGWWVAQGGVNHRSQK